MKEEIIRDMPDVHGIADIGAVLQTRNDEGAQVVRIGELRKRLVKRNRKEIPSNRIDVLVDFILREPDALQQADMRLDDVFRRQETTLFLPGLHRQCEGRQRGGTRIELQSI